MALTHRENIILRLRVFKGLRTQLKKSELLLSVYTNKEKTMAHLMWTSIAFHMLILKIDISIWVHGMFRSVELCMGCVTSLEETQTLSSDLKSTILECSIRTRRPYWNLIPLRSWNLMVSSSGPSLFFPPRVCKRFLTLTGVRLLHKSVVGPLIHGD